MKKSKQNIPMLWLIGGIVMILALPLAMVLLNRNQDNRNYAKMWDGSNAGMAGETPEQGEGNTVGSMGGGGEGISRKENATRPDTKRRPGVNRPDNIPTGNYTGAKCSGSHQCGGGSCVGGVCSPPDPVIPGMTGTGKANGSICKDAGECASGNCYGGGGLTSNTCQEYGANPGDPCKGSGSCGIGRSCKTNSRGIGRYLGGEWLASRSCQ